MSSSCCKIPSIEMLVSQSVIPSRGVLGGVSPFAFSNMDKAGLVVMSKVDAVINENLAGLGYGE